MAHQFAFYGDYGKFCARWVGLELGNGRVGCYSICDVDEFGGEEYHNNPRFASVTNEIKVGLTDRNSESVDANLSELKQIIERYLPVRSPSAVIETEYHDDKLILSGAVEKTLAFREDLFVDIFDQQGKLVDTIELKDNSSGLFSKTISVPLSDGVYVAQLEYHDIVVTDFFNVK